MRKRGSFCDIFTANGEARIFAGFSKRILILFLLTALVIGLGADAATAANEPLGVFRYHVPLEPSSLDPARLTSTDASYFFNNIMRGLYS